MINQILHGDARELAKTLPDNSVHCIVTSPPYFGLRDYGVDGQMGLEKTPEAFVSEMVALFSILKQKLRDDGTLWLNIGDSYAGYWGDSKAREEDRPSAADKNGFVMNSRPSFAELNGKYDSFGPQRKRSREATSTLKGGQSTQNNATRSHETITTPGYKPKDLIGIPWMLAFALRADGWYLRQDIIWHKPNPMPESVRDRCTKSHEYIFLFSKSDRYYFDQISIMTPVKEHTDRVKYAWGRAIDGSVDDVRLGKGVQLQKDKTYRKSGNLARKPGSERGCPEDSGANVDGNVPWEGAMANKRSVWTVSTQPFKEAHFATFPERLIIDCIKAGTAPMCCCVCGAPFVRFFEKELVAADGASFNTRPDERDRVADNNDQASNRVKDGHKPGHANKFTTKGWTGTCDCHLGGEEPCVVLDPFMGAGTTALVARKLHRNFIGFELNKEYIAIAEKRLLDELGLFK